QSAYYQRLSDPRWVGSAKITYGDGTTTNTTFQALNGFETNAMNVSIHYLYLSWRFTGMPAGTPEQNILWVGLQERDNMGMLHDRIIKINLKTSTPTADQSGGLISETNYYPRNANGKLGPLISPVPGWLPETMRVWIDADGHPAP